MCQSYDPNSMDEIQECFECFMWYQNSS